MLTPAEKGTSQNIWKHSDTPKDVFQRAVKEFTTDKADLHPAKVSNLEMGYIFEELIRRFSEAHNEDAGQHYTPRGVTELMVNLIFTNDRDALVGEGDILTIYDPAACCPWLATTSTS